MSAKRFGDTEQLVGKRSGITIRSRASKAAAGRTPSELIAEALYTTRPVAYCTSCHLPLLCWLTGWLQWPYTCSVTRCLGSLGSSAWQWTWCSCSSAGHQTARKIKRYLSALLTVTLSKWTMQEVQRRRSSLMYYLLRDPIYDKYTK